MAGGGEASIAERSIGRGEVDDPYLRAFRPPPAVAGEGSGDVDLPADAVEDRLTEGALGGAEADGPHRLPVAAAQPNADMPRADDARIDDAVPGQGEERLRCPLAEGPARWSRRTVSAVAPRRSGWRR